VERLLGSARRHGLEPTLVARGERWTSNADKASALLPVVGGLPAADTVLVVDAYDVLFFAGAGEIERRFAATSGRPLFNGEQGFYCPAPWRDEARTAFEADDVPYPFLNSGVLIGRAGDLAELLVDAARVIREHDLRSDQAAFYRLALDAPDRVDVDRTGALFCCTGAMQFRGWWDRRPPALQLDGPVLVDRSTGLRPCLLHSPGRKDRYQERVYRASMGVG